MKSKGLSNLFLAITYLSIIYFLGLYFFPTLFSFSDEKVFVSIIAFLLSLALFGMTTDFTDV